VHLLIVAAHLQVRSCCMYDYKAQFEFSFPATYGETTIEVIESDCLEAAIHLKLQRGTRCWATNPLTTWSQLHDWPTTSCSNASPSSSSARNESGRAEHGFTQATRRRLQERIRRTRGYVPESVIPSQRTGTCGAAPNHALTDLLCEHNNNDNRELVSTEQLLPVPGGSTEDRQEAQVEVPSARVWRSVLAQGTT
jgi:hypothetical protein